MREGKRGVSEVVRKDAEFVLGVVGWGDVGESGEGEGSVWVE